MPRYSEERKAAVLKKLLPPQNRTVASVGAEEGISGVTLYSWQRDSRKTIKKLQAEVRRKDRVLAETTSLVLSKNLEALYGETPDNEDN